MEALSLYKYQLRSLDFVINRFCMKLFRTTDIQVVAECQSYFGPDLPSVVLARRSAKFLDRYRASQYLSLFKFVCLLPFTMVNKDIYI